MKQFIKILSIVVILVALVLGILEYKIVNTNIDEYTYKHKYIVENGAEIETLAVGTSHIFFGIDPQCFKTEAFNLGFNAQPLKVTLATLNRYDKNLSNLKTVVIDFTDFSFRKEGFNIPEQPSYYVHYNAFMGYKGEEYDITNKFLIYGDAYLFRKYLTNIAKGKDCITCNSLGLRVLDADKSSLIDIKENGDFETNKLNYQDINAIPKNIAAVDSIVQFCNSRDIRVVFITTPVWSTYYNNMNMDNYNEMQLLVKDIVAKHNVEYYNYMYDTRFIREDFYDSHHLSAKGAKKLTTILADTLGI